MKTRVENRLAQIRKSRGVGASDLARRVNVSRQTIYAIEAGTYVPNTEVALRLAQELEVTIDELFTLGQDGQKAPVSLAAEVLSGSPAEKGQPVRISQVGSRWISVPVSASPYYMPEADGVIQHTGESKPPCGPSGFCEGRCVRKKARAKRYVTRPQISWRTW